MTRRPLLAVDWGTSSLRGAWLDESGQVLQERAFDRGILSVAAGQFPAVFDSCFGDWMSRPGALCLMSGMVGSQQGWQQAAYCPCPADLTLIAASLTWVRPGCLAIVPGLSCEHGAVPDVMRGEETQVLGAMQLLGLRDSLLVLPGTHSKWVRLRDAAIESFATCMTGEFYALLRQHSILARSLPADDGVLDRRVFCQGVEQALAGSSLLNTAFSTRTLALFERLKPEVLPSYLSGLVIGEELRAQSLPAGSSLVLVGSENLTQRYQCALELLGVSSQSVGSQAAWAGLWTISQTI
jgi:2-dehydro-3-deoxygalactonokinase